MELITDRKKARRWARAIVSDVSLYNQDKIRAGIEQDNLFETMEAELQEGRELYESRVDPALLGNTHYYDQAVVDVLFKPAGKFPSKIW
jgi:hypothetical protein